MAQEAPGISSVTGVSDTFKNFVNGLRDFLRDYAPLNRIVENVETSDRMLAHSTLMMLSDFSGSPPPLGWFDLDRLVDTHYMYHTCIAGAAYYTMMSVLNLMKRNELPFNDGGLTVDTPALMAQIERQAILFRDQWERQKRAKKISLNIEGVYGVDSTSSEYATINDWVGRSGYERY